MSGCSVLFCIADGLEINTDFLGLDAGMFHSGLKLARFRPFKAYFNQNVLCIS